MLKVMMFIMVNFNVAMLAVYMARAGVRAVYALPIILAVMTLGMCVVARI